MTSRMGREEVDFCGTVQSVHDRMDEAAGSQEDKRVLWATYGQRDLNDHSLVVDRITATTGWKCKHPMLRMWKLPLQPLTRALAAGVSLSSIACKAQD